MNKCLIHVCCLPCLLGEIDKLRELNLNYSLFFSNSNMDTLSEFNKRKDELSKLNYPIIIDEYDHGDWLSSLDCLEKDPKTYPENSDRCLACLKYRLKRAFDYAKKNNFQYVFSTLSISLYKDTDYLNKLGLDFEKQYGIKYLLLNISSKEWKEVSLKKSKELNCYRQKYCGCEFSKDS